MFSLSNPSDWEGYLRSQKEVVEKALDERIPRADRQPKRLHEAIRYSLFAGGKRLRPILCLTTCQTLCGHWEPAIPWACAIECIHTYSLIHDDLPCMDNDDWRRGRPTLHRVFGEAIAILAGDALQALAFEIASSAKGTPRYPVPLLLGELARAAGSRALVGGQVGDLESEGKEVSLTQLRLIHRRKTAALIVVSVRLGAMAADAETWELKQLTRFARFLGVAFQIRDDVLDVTQTQEKLGKTAGKDLQSQKATYPRIVGLAEANRLAALYTHRALEALRPFGERASPWIQLAHHLLERDR
ncbi:polyprenyl synthetase family protein [Candidatus Methylacidithermus pantelleriae]|uniref:Farnesyl diphosphate synthase n=1 Tax=Candidatus Methylacidithermus pantelleriae TaxID=2744239 RepID=A0A8J2BQ43_9BACT|nr:farnesyl diphosphate synthase [Candidatus Methylacidithermus pantelleriae]CAF0702631.1 Farnesyl diphosphate synthase [Candidatus Methylacidithermus pantelleriae]